MRTDPIFAAIDKHRAALHAAGQQQSQAEDSARWDLGEVVPSTLFGLLALVSYINTTDVFAEDDLARVLVSTEKVLRAVQ